MGPIVLRTAAIVMAAAADQCCALSPLHAINGVPLLHGCAPEPGGLPLGTAPTRAAWGLASCGPKPSAVCAPVGLRPPLCPLRVRCCAAALRLLRASAAGRRARSARLAARSPRYPRSATCAPLSRLRGRSLVASAFSPALAALRPSCSGGLAARGLGPCAARARRGGRLRPLRGKGRARSRPAPLRPLRAAFWGAGAGRFFCAPCASARLAASGGGCSWAALLGLRVRIRLRRSRTVARPGALLRWWPWGSPLRPSRPRRPRWGLRGSVRPPALGAPAPAPVALPTAPGCFRYVQNFGHIDLDICRLPWYSVLVRPVPLLRGLPLAWYPWTARKPLDRKIRRLFSLPFCRSVSRRSQISFP